jgi:NAD-dependent dihydropyrimidine dehydrogenase PreA subunit
MARALLGNGPVNTATEYTQGNSGRCISVEKCYCVLLGNSAPMKTVARNHVTCSLCGLFYATIELGFLCVIRAEAI